MENLGWKVEIQTFTDGTNVLKRPIQFNNIIATLDENAPEGTALTFVGGFDRVQDHDKVGSLSLPKAR